VIADQADDAVAALDQFGDDATTDVAGGAGDQNAQRR
jgi:hypothetical protein